MLLTTFKLIKLHLQLNLADLNTLFLLVSFFISFLNKLEKKNKTHLQTLQILQEQKICKYSNIMMVFFTPCIVTGLIFF